MNTQVMPTGYGPRFARTPEVYPDEGTGMSSIGYGAMSRMGQGYPGMAQGGGQAAAPQAYPGMPAAPGIAGGDPRQAMIQQNLQHTLMGRANEQSGMAAFAAAAPMPTDPQAAAARRLYIAAHQANALAMRTQNYNANVGFDDANGRANDMNGAQVGLLGSQANENNARANQANFLTPHQGGLIDSQANENNARAAIYPNQGNLLDSQAGLNDANSNRIGALTPGMVQSQGIQNQLNQQLIPPEISLAQAGAEGAQLNNDRTAAQNQYAGPMAQAQVGALNAGTASMPALQKRIAELEAQLNKRNGTGDPISQMINQAGLPPAGTQPIAPTPPAVRAAAAPQAAMNVPMVNNASDYNRLPKGSAYQDPQGNRRMK